MEREKLSVKYHGDMAETYDDLREGTKQWLSEQQIVEGFLSTFGSEGATVLDVPVGTGRFFGAYAASEFVVTGVDISSSMLAKARVKAEEGSLAVELHEGTIESLDYLDGSFDLVICIRLMDWVPPDVLETALGELARVARRAIIVSIPTYTPFLELTSRFPSGLLRLFRQWKLRLYLARTRNDTVVHSRANVYSVLDRLGLEVSDRVCVDDESVDHWRRGTERDIYFLRAARSGPHE